jgi:hypothetical protein
MSADEVQPASITRHPGGWRVWAHGTPTTTATVTTTRAQAKQAAAAALAAAYPEHYPDQPPTMVLVDRADDWTPDEVGSR